MRPRVQDEANAYSGHHYGLVEADREVNVLSREVGAIRVRSLQTVAAVQLRSAGVNHDAMRCHECRRDPS